MTNYLFQNQDNVSLIDVTQNSIAHYLLHLGIMPQHLGFGYLLCAVSLICRNPYSYYGRSTDYFAEISEKFNVSKTRASRCMNYAIRYAWSIGRNAFFRELFPEYSDAFAPTVNEFVCRISVEIIDISRRAYARQQDYPEGNDALK